MKSVLNQVFSTHILRIGRDIFGSKEENHPASVDPSVTNRIMDEFNQMPEIFQTRRHYYYEDKYLTVQLTTIMPVNPIASQILLDLNLPDLVWPDRDVSWDELGITPPQ